MATVFIPLTTLQRHHLQTVPGRRGSFIKRTMWVCLPTLVFGLVLVQRSVALSGADSEISRVEENANSVVELHRQKRGWGSVIFIGTTLALRGTSLGLSLSQAITGGCVYFPSICTDKKAIERLEAETRALASEYEEVYIQAKVEFLKLRTANNNNAYISYYINETIRAIQELEDIQDNILDQMEIELPKLFKIFQASSENVTSDLYLRSLLGEVEFTLSDIRQTLSAEKHNILVGIAIQFAVEAVVSRFIFSYQKAYNQLRQLEKEDILSTTYFSLLFSSDPTESGILLDPDHPMRDELIKRKLAENGAKGKFKMAPKVLKQMLSNTFVKTPQKVLNSMKKWSKIRTWKGFKGKFLHSIKGPLEKLSKVKQFFTKKAYRKLAVSNYKASWSVKVMAGIGVVLDVVSQAVAAANWRSVADQISISRRKYEEYKTKLQQELVELKNETKKAEIVWEDIIDTFRTISVAFREVVRNATNYSNFSDVVGAPGLPVDLNNPLFTTDFDNLHPSSLEQKQTNVIGFLKEVDNNMTRVTAKLRSRKTLYEVVLRETTQSKPVVDILSSAQTAYRYDISDTVRNYGKALMEKDVVCSVAILLPTLQAYDFLPLAPFRPTCQVNSSAFEHLKLIAQNQQRIAQLHKSVARYVNVFLMSNTENLGIVRDLVINEVSNGDGSNIQQDDILCAIAHEFPDKDSYDGRSLVSFRSRPECTQI